MKFLVVFVSTLFLFNPRLILSKDEHTDSTNLKAQPSIHLSTGAIFGILAAVPGLVLLVLAILKFWCRNSLDLLRREIDGLRGALVRSSFKELSGSGLDKSSIESLPLFRLSSIKGSGKGLECAVCLSKFEDSEFLRLLPKCGHAFHSNCIERWLEGKSNCPLCRSSFEPSDLSMSIAASSEYKIFVHSSADYRILLLDRPQQNAIMSNVIAKNQWSAPRSSDMLSLSSETLHLLSTNRFSASVSGSGVEPADDKGQMLDRSRSVYETSLRLITVEERRSMSEIISVTRFESSMKNRDEEQI